MLSNRDLQFITDELQKIPTFDDNRTDGYTITFHYFQRVASGGGVGRHYDNAPLDAWADDPGFTSTEQTISVPCTYIPNVQTTNLVQEGYHETSDLEVLIDQKTLFDFKLTADDLNNRFEFVTVQRPHTVGREGRASETTQQAYDIRTVREKSMSGRLIAIVVGLSLRNADTADVAKVDLVDA